MPLAMLLPDEEVHRHTARGGTATVCALSTRIDKTITLPVEPKVNGKLIMHVNSAYNYVYKWCTYLYEHRY